MSIERQVRIILGICVLVGPVVYIWHEKTGLLLTAFMGVSLIFSGWANFCGTRAILARMPWNKG